MGLCTGLDGNPNKGKTCPAGFVQKLLMSEEPISPIANSAVDSLTTWEDLVKAAKPFRLFAFEIDITEPVNEEKTRFVLINSGAEIITGRTKGLDVYKVLSSIEGYKTIHKQFGKINRTMYLYKSLSSGGVEGKEITVDTLEQIKVAVNTSYSEAVPGGDPEMLHFLVQELDDYKADINRLPVESFNMVDELESVRTMEFTEGDAASTTTLSIDAKDVAGNGIADLTTGASNFFKVQNDTTVADVVVTGATVVGNRYELTFIAQTSADVLRPYYAAPDVSDELYEALQANAPSISVP